MGQTIYQVDSFTTEPFKGNPAGVCLLRGPADEAWMQAVASEMNLSETAFLYPEEDGYRLRWFTPLKEVRLCGHATLASAHILWESGQAAPGETLRFHTLSGLLTAGQRRDWIELDFPARPVSEVEPPEGLLEALGVQARFVGQSNNSFLVEVGSAEEVTAVQPDFTRLAALPVRAVMVTAPVRAEDHDFVSRFLAPALGVNEDPATGSARAEDFDFVSRFFAPALGINEDPVTGSAHCSLGPYWSAKLGKTDLRAYQASRRGGMMGVRVLGERVVLAGQAVTVLRAELV